MRRWGCRLRFEAYGPARVECVSARSRLGKDTSLSQVRLTVLTKPPSCCSLFFPHGPASTPTWLRLPLATPRLGKPERRSAQAGRTAPPRVKTTRQVPGCEPAFGIRRLACLRRCSIRARQACDERGARNAAGLALPRRSEGTTQGFSRLGGGWTCSSEADFLQPDG